MADIFTTITVDWEGRELDDGNLLAMRTFNQLFPEIPITHFICPAYLARAAIASERATITNKINSVIKDIDEVALHIHCWYSLVMAAGINALTQPTVNPNNGPGTCVNVPGLLDCGHGVPLGCYSVPQIKQILLTGNQLLRTAPIKNIDLTRGLQSFRCGAWLAGDRVLNGVREVGFLYEASAAPSLYFSQVASVIDPNSPMYLLVAKMWSGRARRQPRPGWRANTQNAQAYPGGVQGMFPPPANMPAISDPVWMANLIQIPDTGALADYTSQATLQAYIVAAEEQAEEIGKDVFISMGWHQESAGVDSDFHQGVANIQVIMNILNANPNRLVFLTVTQAAQLWQAAQLSPPVFPREEELVRLKQPVALPHIPVTGREIIYG